MCITENVVELMMGRIKTLPLETQTILSLASAMGNTFEVLLLSQITEMTTDQIIRWFEPAVRMGLIIRLNEDFKWLKHGTDDIAYKFLHDRVQQASYELLHIDESRAVHLKIGRLLLSLSNSDIEERLFGNALLLLLR